MDGIIKGWGIFIMRRDEGKHVRGQDQENTSKHIGASWDKPIIVRGQTWRVVRRPWAPCYIQGMDWHT